MILVDLTYPQTRVRNFQSLWCFVIYLQHGE